MDAANTRKELLRMFPEAETTSKSDHLLRVVASVNRDASDAWTQIWGELKPHVGPSGTALPSIQNGFVPECGWPEFLERMWLLKHYLDSIGRICQGKPNP